MTKQEPRLCKSELTQRRYIVTKYKENDDGNVKEAKEKFDITEQLQDMWLLPTPKSNDQ